MLVFNYRIGGVDYECSQDITNLTGIVDVPQVRAGFPCSIRYQPGNPTTASWWPKSGSAARQPAGAARLRRTGALRYEPLAPRTRLTAACIALEIRHPRPWLSRIDRLSSHEAPAKTREAASKKCSTSGRLGYGWVVLMSASLRLTLGLHLEQHLLLGKCSALVVFNDLERSGVHQRIHIAMVDG